MYLLNEFNRKKGSKDKTKRKFRFPKKEAIKLGAIIGATALTAGVGATLGKKYLFKNETKNLNNKLRNLIRQDREKITSQWKNDYIKNANAGKTLGLSEIDSGITGLNIANANKKYYSKQYKSNRRNQLLDSYKRLNTKKKEVGSALGISTLIPLSLGYSISKNRNKNVSSKKN